MIKRKMSLLLSAVVVASGVGMATPAFAANAAKQLPAISYIAPEHTIATDNVPFTFALEAANYEGDVQYRIFVQKDGGKWTELTDGYTKAVNAKVPYIPQVKKNLSAGKYKASVWVKRAEVKEGTHKNSLGSYDTYYVKNFSIGTAKSLANRVDLNDLEIKDTYKVGEKVNLKSKDGYQYKLHIYDPSAKVRRDGWKIDKTYETGDATSYTFTKPGKYLVDVWGMTNKSSDAAKAQGYDGWKLKVVTVEENKEEDVKATIKIESGITAFDRYVKATLNVSDPENYEVTVCGKKLQYVDKNGSKFFQGVVTETDEKEINSKVVIKKIGEKVEVPSFKVAPIEAGITAFDRYVKVTLDTKTPEKFDVTVCGKKLQYVDKNGNKFFQGVVTETDEKEINSHVVVTVK
ncbi:hypothetical protein [Clostridium massiliodielmoense]|uniref:hypothetical protein n=1 Tax=Clostridium massiliodielmoense TaxID=1776385 RepID=UPI0004D99636|nr:hypothetical protein [Clostridium massiliodielmoense]KEH98799.1 hypothetical protein Z962_09725 [Clostridium botulinum C/D str. BKT12695]